MTKQEQENAERSNDRLILLCLGVVAMACIVGIVILAAFKIDAQSLVVIASASVGALATKITGRTTTGDNHEGEEDFAILGRAATKGIIAEAMRQMGTED